MHKVTQYIYAQGHMYTLLRHMYMHELVRSQEAAQYVHIELQGVKPCQQ